MLFQDPSNFESCGKICTNIFLFSQNIQVQSRNHNDTYHLLINCWDLHRRHWYNPSGKKKLAESITIKLADSCFYYLYGNTLSTWRGIINLITYLNLAWRSCFLILKSIESFSFFLRSSSRSETFTTTSFEEKE